MIKTNVTITDKIKQIEGVFPVCIHNKITISRLKMNNIILKVSGPNSKTLPPPQRNSSNNVIEKKNVIKIRVKWAKDIFIVMITKIQEYKMKIVLKRSFS